MALVLDWQRDANPEEVIRRAVEFLAAGQLVVFPTETVYGLAASAKIPEAVSRLRLGKGRPGDKPLTLAMGAPQKVMDWLPGLSVVGQRLARRCWPGPLTLVSGAGVERGRANQLSEEVLRQVCPTGTLGLRVPAHAAILRVLEQLPEPLVLSSANRSGEPAAVTAEEVIAAVGDEAALVIDGGRCHFGQASTVVQVEGSTWEILREGVLSRADLQRCSACVIVFVCTGNTCRSPMAEALCKRLLADRLGCSVEELPERGFIVLSAGLAAMMGSEAAPEAVAAAHELGAELAGHRSRPLTPYLISQADYLFVMTQSHLLALSAQFPQLGPRLLSPEGEDLPDPIGCDQQVYRDCARQIVRHLERFLPQLQG